MIASLLMQKTCQRGSCFLHPEQNGEQQRRSFTDIFLLYLAARHSYEQQERYHDPICWLFFGTNCQIFFLLIDSAGVSGVRRCSVR